MVCIMLNKTLWTKEEIEEYRIAAKDEIRVLQKSTYIENEEIRREKVSFLEEQKELTDNPVVMSALIKRLIREAHENEKETKEDIDLIAETLNEQVDLECKVANLRIFCLKLLNDNAKLKQENKWLKEQLDKRG